MVTSSFHHNFFFTTSSLFFRIPHNSKIYVYILLSPHFYSIFNLARLHSKPNSQDILRTGGEANRPPLNTKVEHLHGKTTSLYRLSTKQSHPISLLNSIAYSRFLLQLTEEISWYSRSRRISGNEVPQLSISNRNCDPSSAVENGERSAPRRESLAMASAQNSWSERGQERTRNLKPNRPHLFRQRSPLLLGPPLLPLA